MRVCLVVSLFFSLTCWAAANHRICDERLAVVPTLVSRLSDDHRVLYSFRVDPRKRVRLEVVRDLVPFREWAAGLTATGVSETELFRQLRWKGRSTYLQTRKVRVLHLRFIDTTENDRRFSSISNLLDTARVKFKKDFEERAILSREALRDYRRKVNVVQFSWTGDALSLRDLEDNAFANSSNVRSDAGFVPDALKSKNWSGPFLAFDRFPPPLWPHAGVMRWDLDWIRREGYGVVSVFFRPLPE